MSEQRDSFWLCSICGYFPGNRANWCNAGCGSDYREMRRVGTAEALTHADGAIEKQREWTRQANAESYRARSDLDSLRSQVARVREICLSAEAAGPTPEDGRLCDEILALLDTPVPEGRE